MARVRVQVSDSEVQQVVEYNAAEPCMAGGKRQSATGRPRGMK